MERLIYIYVLRDPRDNQIRYVGATLQPEQRLGDHEAHRGSRTSEKQLWMAGLIEAGLRAKLELIDVGWRSNAGEMEVRWVRYYLQRGHSLLNKPARYYRP